MCWLARFYRLRFRKVVFIGVTGSCGKTTTKDLVAAVLSSRFIGQKSPQSENTPYTIAQKLFALGFRDQYCVQEVGASHPGSLEEPLVLLKPQVGVVTTSGYDHYSAFRALEAVAAKKGKLVRALPQDGVAVLNADDPHVLAMRSLARAPVITYGLAPGATLRAEEVRSAWPERLSFTVWHGGCVLPVQTKLCGTYWVTSVLAALAVGVAMGVPLATAVAAIEAVEPFEGRMSPIIHADGVTFIQDDWKAPLWTIPPALDFLKQARAKRKIAVIGTISDIGGKENTAYVNVARQALEAADYVFFVGRWASRCLRARRHPGDDALRAFGNVKDVSDFLRSFLCPGDLVLLKGTTRVDHLARIILIRTAEVRCWLSDCGKDTRCGSCRLVRVPAGSGLGTATVAGSDGAAPAGGMTEDTGRIEDGSIQAVVGLGNFGNKFHGTRHNVGQRVLDVLAVSLGAKWKEDGPTLVARATCQGESFYLVKPLALMNSIGPALRPVMGVLGIRPTDCILVHDDIDLPLGVVRVRTGGTGGHNGVRSIYEAFQAEGLRRIRVGVGRPPRNGNVVEHVLAMFSPSELPKVEKACTEAAEQAMKLIIADSKRRIPDASISSHR